MHDVILCIHEVTMQPWDTLASRPLLDRRPWLTVWEEDVRLPDDTIIHGYLRSRARDYSMVFALLADGTVPLVRQYKHGPGRPSYDLPAGYLDGPDEPPLAGAQRELHEETGLVADRWQPLGSPGHRHEPRGGPCPHFPGAGRATRRAHPILTRPRRWRSATTRRTRCARWSCAA